MKEVNVSMATSGYSREEAYFFEQNQKLIEELRAKRARRFDIAKKLEMAQAKLEQRKEAAAAA